MTAVLALALEREDLPTVQIQALGFLYKLVGTREGLAEAGEDGIVPRAVHLFLSHGAHMVDWPRGLERDLLPGQAIQGDKPEPALQLPWWCGGIQDGGPGLKDAALGHRIRFGIKNAALRLLHALAADGLLRHIMVMEGLLPGVRPQFDSGVTVCWQLNTKPLFFPHFPLVPFLFPPSSP